MNAVPHVQGRGSAGFAHWRSEIAPFVVVRTAGVSVDRVRQFLAPRLGEPIAAARAARVVMQEHRQAIEDGFHVWVAALQQDRFRHRVLDVRRSVHNTRMPDVDGDFEQRLSGFDSSLAQRFAAWREAMQQWTDALAALEAHGEELRSEAFASALLPLFDDHVFALGLSHSAPTIFRDREKNASIQVKASRRLRFVNTLLGYLIRASTKTSPLTTFMQWTVVPLDERQDVNDWRLQDARMEAVSALNRAPLAALRQSLSARCDTNSPLRMCPLLRIHEPDQIDLWALSYTQRDDRMWRRDVFTRLRLSRDLISLLMGWPDNCPRTIGDAYAELERVGFEPARAQATLNALIRKGVLLAGPEPQPFADRLAPQLMEWVGTTGDAALLAAARALAQAESDAQRFSTATLSERLEMGSALIEALGTAAQSAGFSSALSSAWLVQENSSWSGVRGRFGRPFFDAAQSVMAVVKRKLQVSQQYLWLRDFFVQKYGHDGVCTDALDFFAGASQAYPAERDWRERRTSTPSSSDLDLSGWKIPVCFHFQLGTGAASSVDALPVVNAVYSRGIWVMGRYTVGKEGAQLADHARTWLKRCAAPAEPVAVVFGAEASNLQVHGPLTDRFIDCSANRSDSNRLCPHDLVLRHDSSTGLLRCQDRDGRELRPVYLGGSQPGPHFGAAHFLILIGEPVVTQPPPARMLFNESSQAQVVRHQPRHVEEGCVLLRATWWIRARAVMAAVGERSFADAVLWLHEFFEGEGIPKEGFVLGQTLDQWKAVDNEAGGYRKPMWYDLNDAWCLKRLLTICEEMDYLVVREALPSLEAGAASVNGAPHVAEYHVEAWIEVGNRP